MREWNLLITCLGERQGNNDDCMENIWFAVMAGGCAFLYGACRYALS